MAVTRITHDIIRNHFSDREKQIAVDATCGNGHDCLFLCELGFQTVYGFDVQTQAIETTRQRLAQQEFSAILHLAGHEKINQLVKAPIDCVMFNLGYLPGSDKSITTLKETSLKALEQSMELLSEDGLITLCCYPGHDEGYQELTNFERFFSRLQQENKVKFSREWRVDRYDSPTKNAHSPCLFVLTSLF